MMVFSLMLILMKNLQYSLMNLILMEKKFFMNMQEFLTWNCNGKNYLLMIKKFLNAISNLKNLILLI